MQTMQMNHNILRTVQVICLIWIFWCKYCVWLVVAGGESEVFTRLLLTGPGQLCPTSGNCLLVHYKLLTLGCSQLTKS